MRRKTPVPSIIFRWLLLAVIVLSAAVPSTTGKTMPIPELEIQRQLAPALQAAGTNTISLSVVSARTEPKAGVNEGDPVVEYQYLISVDNTGDPFDQQDACNPFEADGVTRNPDYPTGCTLPSLRTVPGWAPVLTQGTQAELSETASLTLPDGKYLITVQADGYRVDGQHFTLPMEAGANGTALVEVAVHPLPLPVANMTIIVFDDKSMTNGQYDGPVEQGLAGFRASLNDIAGEITTDIYGNPLCTVYQRDANDQVILDGDGAPIIVQKGTGCYSDEDGYITIPNIGPIRYDVLVIPPDGEAWVQTTTLEGSQGWDTWLQEGGTGMDNEFVVAAEPFPWTVFGFVKPSTSQLPPISGGGTVTGTVVASSIYSPMDGGLPFQGDIWGGMSGVKVLGPVARPWLSLNDLQNGDTTIWVGQGSDNGTFEIPNVPAGNYTLTYWDEKQHFILDFVQLTVHEGQTTDVGVRTLTGWFTEVNGTVFLDENENGKRDQDDQGNYVEKGIPNYLVVLKDRDNTEIDRMSIVSLTDPDGGYAFEKAYPMGSWMVLEAYSDLYHTTGITYQVDNQPQETTVLGNGVDVAFLPILGQPVRLDWGVKAYQADENGGIVGTVFYDTVRAEDDASLAGAEPWSPGIPNLTLNLYLAEKDPTTGEFLYDADGSIKKAFDGTVLATTTTETFTRPVNCQARNADGEPGDYPALAPSTGDYECLEGPMMGTQIGTWPTADGGLDFAAPLDGNYGFTEITVDPATGAALENPMAIPPGDYLVEVVVPDDPLNPGNKLYQVTREEDLNIFDGDTWTPAIPQPPCAGPQEVVDVLGVGTDGPNAVDNPAFVEAIGGSRFEGQTVHRCNLKLITLNNGRSIAPPFHLFTQVPIPGRWKGYIVDDLNISTNHKELFFGEKAGVPNVPIGVYDFTGRLVETIHSDKNGVFEALLPSTGTFNTPTPSGMTAGMYYIYGNDPGTPDRPNSTYNPQYRSIGATFEIYPGVIVPADLAPVQNGALIPSPGSNLATLPLCAVPDTEPQFFAVDVPYIDRTSNPTGALTIYGDSFGLSAGQVLLGSTPLQVTSWSNTIIEGLVPTTVPAGMHQLSIAAANNQTSVNGLTIHVLGAGYMPRIYEVGVGKKYDPTNPVYDGTGRGPIQHAIDTASAEYTAVEGALVVVFPGPKSVLQNPLGSYFENLVLYRPIRLQGTGPGGAYADNTGIDGVHIDGRAVGGDSPYTDWWRKELIPTLWLDYGWDRGLADNDGNPRVFEGSVVTVFAKGSEFTSQARPLIDGLVIEGGDQQGFPNNLDMVTGEQIPGVAPEVVVQGGGIFVNGYASYLQISNNVIQTNGGAYGGGIRLGTPHVPAPDTDNNNNNVRILNNRILANGGTNLAGGIALFAGAERYEIGNNDICGNFSAEYGGGISHYGLSEGGKIHHNRIYFNRSYDEGGGIMVAGELPADYTVLSPGAGPVNIYNNLVQANLANDDGGGIRFLMANDFEYNVYNNMIVNNVSTHEGGGVSLNDATNVRIYNNTIMKNITTATAMTSDGRPAPAGLSSSRNSVLLQNTLPIGMPGFSSPLLYNNILWDNRAGTWTGETVVGIGAEGDPSPVYHYDLGVSDNTGQLRPTYSILQVPNGLPSATNRVGSDPMVLMEYDSQLRIYAWRGNPNFRNTQIVSVDLPTLGTMGDYHLQGNSPAANGGSQTSIYRSRLIISPLYDFDDDMRGLLSNTLEIGADELTNYDQWSVEVNERSLFILQLPFLYR